MTTAEIIAARAANTATITTNKTGYNYRIRKSADISAAILDENGQTLDFIAAGIGNHKTALEWAEWRAGAVRAEYATAAQMVVYCGEIEIAVIDITDEPKSTAPEFDDLTHAAQNVVLSCQHDGDTYRKLIAPLTAQLEKRIRKGQAVELNHLAGCSTMAKITLAGVRDCQKWDIHVTKEERRAAALYLAACIIDTAKEEAGR